MRFDGARGERWVSERRETKRWRCEECEKKNEALAGLLWESGATRGEMEGTGKNGKATLRSRWWCVIKRKRKG